MPRSNPNPLPTLPQSFIIINIEVTDNNKDKGTIKKISGLLVSHNLSTIQAVELNFETNTIIDELSLFEEHLLSNQKRPILAAWGNYWVIPYLQDFYKQIGRIWPYAYRSIDLESILLWEASMRRLTLPDKKITPLSLAKIMGLRTENSMYGYNMACLNMLIQCRKEHVRPDNLTIPVNQEYQQLGGIAYASPEPSINDSPRWIGRTTGGTTLTRATPSITEVQEFERSQAAIDRARRMEQIIGRLESESATLRRGEYSIPTTNSLPSEDEQVNMLRESSQQAIRSGLTPPNDFPLPESILRNIENHRNEQQRAIIRAMDFVENRTEEEEA